MFISNGVQNKLKHNDLRNYGCYILTLIAWVQIAFGKEIIKDEQALVEKFNEWQFRNWINKLPNEKGVIYPWARNPVAIFNELALEAGKGDGYFAHVAHTANALDFPKTKRFPVFYENDNNNPLDHFCLGELDTNGDLRIIFDSWTRSALSLGRKPKNYRRFW